MNWAGTRSRPDSACHRLRRLSAGLRPRSGWRLLALALSVLTIGWLGARPALTQPATASRIAMIELAGAIGPANSGYIQRSFAQARQESADLIVLRIDTPGGLVDPMRKIIQEILASPIPVVGFVAPGGAHAASAGTYILYACHLAAMAPGTNLGAATPVEVDLSGTPTTGTPDLKAKTINDAVAYIRSLAELRGRNPAWAERAVREAATLTAGEALQRQVIDLIANDVPQLLAKLDGRAVQAGGLDHVLRLADRELIELGPGWRTQLLSLLTSPTVAYILLLTGIFGILIEILTPGVVAPGVLGAIALMVALYAFQIIPVNFAGLGLILLGVGLMVMEMLVPGIGVFGLGGIVSFVIGSVMLMDTGVPGFDVPMEIIGGVALVASGLLMKLMMMMRRVRLRPATTGAEGMIGNFGQVVQWSGQRGRIRLRGTTWTAHGPADMLPGDRVRVVQVSGLTCEVEPAPEER